MEVAGYKSHIQERAYKAYFDSNIDFSEEISL